MSHVYRYFRALCDINKRLPAINYWRKKFILNVEGFLDPPKHEE